DPRQFLLQFLHHLLDEEVAERYATQSLLAVGDRIEDRRVRPGRPPQLSLLVGVRRQQRLDRDGEALYQRDLHENQRLPGQGGMEKHETAAIGRQPAAEIG